MNIILFMIISVAVCINGAALREQNVPNAMLRRSNPVNLNEQILEIASLQVDQDPKESQRSKREVMFRPLFVYRQQEIKKQHLKEQREQQLRQQQTPITTTRRPQRLDYDPYDFMA